MLLKLSENIASHICHELANSIGACDTCLESFASSGPEGFSTAKMASQSSVSRLKYLRYMYGYNVSPAKLCELATMAHALIKEGRAKLEFTLNGEPFIDNLDDKKNFRFHTTEGKLLFAFIYIAHGDLPYGGTIKVNINHDNERAENEMTIVSTSENLKLRPAVYNVLTNENIDADELNSRNVVVYYARLCSFENDIKYRLVVTENKVEYILPYRHMRGDSY